jgi:outer membrane protein assembly factor BamB
MKKGGAWKLHSKPRPETMGEWRHHRMDPNGNMSSTDRGPVPSGVQWLAGPRYALRGRKNSTMALLTADGRNIYLTENINENLVSAKQRFLIARDGYNSLPIWRTPWKSPNWRGEGQTSFAVVATPEYVFGLQDDKPVALDARTGKLVRTYSCAGAKQIAVLDDALVAHTATGVSVFAIDRQAPRWQARLSEGAQKSGIKPGWRAPKSILAFGADRIYFLDNPGQQLHCLALNDGKKLWQVQLKDAGSYRTVNFAGQGVIGVAQTKMLEVFAAGDGRLLWTRKGSYVPRFGNLQQNGHYLTAEGVWVRTARYDWEIVAPRSGKVIRKFATGMGGKNGCQGAILSGAHLVASRASTFFDLKTISRSRITFSRGGCGVGFVPANGLHYTIPHACACVGKALRGHMGLRGGHSLPPGNYKTALVTGKGPRATAAQQDAPWPTFCGSPARDSFCSTEMPARLRPVWKKGLARVDDRPVSREWALRPGAPLTQAVTDGERAYVNSINAHQLVALDAASGEIRWRYVAEGRISAPPTLFNGLCLFGDHSGYVHCVHAADGSLRWRLRAARNEELIVAYGQLESPWPVLGGVLVDKGVAVFLSGRADGADGGMLAFGVDPLTGRQVWRRPVAGKVGVAGVLTRGAGGVVAVGEIFDAANGRASVDGSDLFRDAVRPRIAGLQDSSWMHMPLARRKNISTRLFTGGGARGSLEAQGHLVAVGKNGDGAYAVHANDKGALASSGAFKWSHTDLGFQPGSLILSGDKVIASGRSGSAGRVVLLSARDGSELWSCDLAAPPIHQGLSAGNGRLYVSCEDGTLHCFASRASSRSPSTGTASGRPRGQTMANTRKAASPGPERPAAPSSGAGERRALQLFEMARRAERIGQREAAAGIYSKIVADYSDTSCADRARKRLASLQK